MTDLPFNVMEALNKDAPPILEAPADMDAMTPEELQVFANRAIQLMYEGIFHAAQLMHGISVQRGWYHTLDAEGNRVPKQRNVGEMLALIHSEISEALEADRKGHADNFGEELADAVIRIFDLCGYKGIDIAEKILAKAEKNRHRKDHDLNERMKPGGKSY